MIETIRVAGATHPRSTMKKRNLIRVAIFALTAIIAGFAFLFRDIPPTLPPFDEARFMQIDGEGIRTVEIKKEDLEPLRQIIEATKKDRFPSQWAAIGALELRANGTTTSTIQMFSNPNEQGPLQISDSYYLGYDQGSLQKILDRAITADRP